MTLREIREDREACPARGTLYVLDEPTTGLHSAAVEKLLVQLDHLVEVGNTIVIVEHNMRVVAGALGSSTWDAVREMKAERSSSGTPAEVARDLTSPRRHSTLMLARRELALRAIDERIANLKQVAEFLRREPSSVGRLLQRHRGGQKNC